ncbi:MAG: acetyl-CoA carboxylase biotin carboxyl carrier protein subunit, partial [Bacteroidales bacterium]
MSQETNKLPDQMQVLEIEGTSYSTLFTKKYASKAPFQLPDEKKILAYLPGTVLEIKVKPGDKVAAGEELLSVEALKMRNTILSPVSGVIAA